MSLLPVGIALEQAIREGDLDRVRRLVRSGVPVTNTALQEAAKNGEKMIVQYLVEHGGADVRADDDAALRAAAQDMDQHTEVVKYLLAHGADVHARDDEALRWAALRGHVEVVEVLLDAGADIHAGDDEALRNAAMEGLTFMTSLLLTAGADVHAGDDEALRSAVSNDHMDVLEFLLAAGANVHAQDDDVLFEAASYGNVKAVQLLLDAGADANAADDDALRVAAQNGYADVVLLLLQEGADVHAEDDEALRMAATEGHTEVVRLLLAAGADVHARADEALRMASQNNHQDCVNLLLMNGGVVPSTSTQFPTLGVPPTQFPSDTTLCVEVAGTRLGGTTGATLVQCGGLYYVRKSVPLAKGVLLYNEYLANRIYDMLHVAVPACRFYETPTDCVLLSEYLTPSEPLAGVPSVIVQQVRDDFAVDAFLANWDVLGQTMDNVLVYQGTPYRVDVGGALYRRAQGMLKTPEDFSFQVVELYSMRCMSSSYKSPHCDVFASLTDDEVATQIRRIAPHVRRDVLPSVEFLPELHSVLQGRIEMMEQWAMTHNRALTQVRTPVAGTESMITRGGYDIAFKLQSDYVRRLKQKRQDLFDALTMYVEGDYYSDFNRQLCTGVLTTKAHDLNDMLTTAFLGLPPISIPILVYRGLPTKIDPARLGCQYVSTSTSKTAAKEFMQGATCCLMKITLPAGVRAFPLRSVGTTMTHEYEVLLPPGGRWIQRGTPYVENGVTTYNYDYIPPGPKYVTDPVFAGMYMVYEGKLLVHKRSARLGGFLSCPGGSIDPKETPKAAAEREAYEEAGVLVSQNVREFYTSPDGKFVGFVDRDTLKPAVLGPDAYSLSEVDMGYDFQDLPGAEVVPGTGHAWVPLKELYTFITRGTVPLAQHYFVNAVLVLIPPTYVDIYVVYDGKLLVHKEVRSGFLYTSNGPIIPPTENQEYAAVRVAAGHAGVKISAPFKQIYQMLHGELVGLVFTATKRPKVRGPNKHYVKEVDMGYDFQDVPGAEVVPGTGHAWIPLQDLYDHIKSVPKGDVSGAFASAVKKLMSP